jgi:hypothetical protein
MRRVLAVLAGTLTMGLVTVPTTVAGAVSPSTTIYDSTTAGATSLPSQCFECAQVQEIGNQVTFGPGSRTVNNVTVTMESWGCESGGIYSNDCVSTDPTFNYPVTLNLYNVGNDGTSVGSLITSVTQTFAIKYRPTSDSTDCPPADYGGAGLWFDGSACNYGIASNVTFTLPDVTVPNNLVYGIAVNTADAGYSPVPCSDQPTGCPANSLNVGLSTTNGSPQTVGSDPVLGAIYQNTNYGAFYCDNGAGGTGTFRPDLPLDYGTNPTNPAESCWSADGPYTPVNESTPGDPTTAQNGYGPAPYYVPAVQFGTACSTACSVNAATGNDANDGTAGSPVATIGKAISLVSSGGTVSVAAGTYHENVVINKPLTLAGANAGTSAAGPAVRSAESIITAPYTSGNDVSVEVASPNVTVDGFSVQQTAVVSCASCAAFGIEVDPTSSNTTVRNSLVAGMTTNGSSATPAGNPIGIFVAGNGSSQPNTVSVNQNAISHITSAGTQHRSAQGILVGDTSNIGSSTGLSIQGNRISSVSGVSWGAYGILFNRGNTAPIVQGNTVSTIQGGGWAHGISLDAPQVGPTIINNDVSGVLAPNPAGGNVADVFFDPGDTSSGTGIVAGNSLTATAAAGLVNGTTGTVPAAANWWGCAGGANTAGCSPAGGSGPITLTPWIASFTPDGTKTGQPGFWPTSVVTSVAPSFTSATNASFNLNQASTFTVVANGLPASVLSESGALPPGVSFNPATGALAGTPTAVGTYPITFTAHNGAYADATQPFTLTVLSNSATITSASSVQIAADKKVNFTVTTGGHPAATVTAPGLPAWLTLTPGTGGKAGTAKLTGVGPVVGGNYTFTIHATNGYGPDTLQSFTVHVLAISSLASASFTKSGPVTQSFTITTTGVATGVSLSATLGGNLAGLTFHDIGNGTATISGQPSAGDRTHLVTVTALAGAARTTQRLAIGISN